MQGNIVPRKKAAYKNRRICVNGEERGHFPPKNAHQLFSCWGVNDKKALGIYILSTAKISKNISKMTYVGKACSRRPRIPKVG